jgi:hypothetical protein
MEDEREKLQLVDTNSTENLQKMISRKAWTLTNS